MARLAERARILERRWPVVVKRLNAGRMQHRAQASPAEALASGIVVMTLARPSPPVRTFGWQE